METEFLSSPNPRFSFLELVGNRGTSDYHSLQIQFRRRLSRGLQALASYSWSHSIDTASASSITFSSNIFVRGLGASANRGPSDFDIRNAFSTGVTYDIPTHKINPFADAVLHGWSMQTFVYARSAPPVDLSYSLFQLLGNNSAVRPDVVPRQPYYLFGWQYPSGKAFNPAAFTPPPTDARGNPVRQGNLGRNSLQGFRAAQWDFAVHREFPIHEELKIQLRMEFFNILNHPNFGSPVGDLSNTAQFGRSTQMLGQFLTFRNDGGGAFTPLYQIGGPRSVQVALKIMF